MTVYDTIADSVDTGARSNRENSAAAGRPIPDDMAMLRTAAELTREFSTAKPAIYWPDFLLSTIVGYSALAGAILLDNMPLALACGVVAILTL